VEEIKEKCLAPPLVLLLKPLNVARRIKPRVRGEHYEMLLVTRRAADAGKPAARVATVKIALERIGI